MRQNLSCFLWQTIGKVDELDASKEEWSQYEEQLTPFFQANDINVAGKKRVALLSVVGPVTYKLLNLLAPVKPDEKAYGELVATLSVHYSLPPSDDSSFIVASITRVNQWQPM